MNLLFVWVIFSVIAGVSLYGAFIVKERNLKAVLDSDSNGELDFFDKTLLVLSVFCPIMHLLSPFASVFVILDVLYVKRKTVNKKRIAYEKELNTLVECRSCRAVKRKYQVPDNTCCERPVMEISKRRNPNVYEFALETGLTPLIDKKTATSLFKATQARIVQEAKRKKEEAASQEEIRKLSEKTIFFEEQMGIYVSKEHKKLEKLRQEFEQRKEAVASTLGQDEAEKLQAILNQFDVTYHAQLDSTQQFEQQSKQHLADMQEKLKTLVN